MNKPVVYKKNGVKQRSDIMLTKEIATTLREMVLSGKKIPTRYPDYVNINTIDGNVVKVQWCNVNKWVLSENVIPEPNVTFRSYMDEARREWKVVQERERDEKLRQDIERELRRTANLRTNVPVITMSGKEVTRPDGSKVRRENAKLLAVKMGTIQFLAERLDRKKYGKIDKTEHEHVVGFSLSDLRKARMQLKEQQNAKSNE